MSKVLLAGSNHILVPNSPRDSKHEILLKFITQIIDNPEDYEQLSEGSLAQANIHDSQKANDVLDNLYLELSQ
ncbi:MAG TPA: hypothetical protein V6D26_17690 [Stenomitos sp.]